MGSLSLTSEQETCSELSSWSAVWHTPPPKPRQRLIPTTDTDTPDLDMLGLDTPGLDTLAVDIMDTPDWDTMASVRLRPSLKLRLMLRLILTTDMDTPDLDMLVLDMLDLDTPGLDMLDLDTPGLDMLAVDITDSDTPDWDTMASVRLKLSLRLRLIPTTDMDTLDLDMLVLDTLVLDTPGWDTQAWDIMAVDTTLVRLKTPYTLIGS